MATFPPRYDVAKKVIRRVAGQVDRLWVYVNDEDPTSETLCYPDWVGTTPPNVRVRLGSRAIGSISDCGKFYGVEDLPHCYHLTLDDDICYPEDYVQRLVEAIKRHGRKVVCGYHGCLIPDEQISSYYESGQKQKIHFRQQLDEDRPAHLLGTGVCGYHTSALKLNLEADFHGQHMADIFLALACQRREVGMRLVAKPNNWLRPYRTQDPGIYNRFLGNDTIQTILINAHEFQTY